MLIYGNNILRNKNNEDICNEIRNCELLVNGSKLNLLNKINLVL